MEKVMVSAAILADMRGPYYEAIVAGGFEPAFPSVRKQLKEGQIVEQVKDFRFILAGSEPYTREVIGNLPGLKVIARAGVGYDAVDVQAATDHGVAVCFAPNTNNEAVSEQTILYLLALSKKMFEQHNLLHAGTWPRKAYGSLRGKTLGIVGLGRVGRQVALRAKPFRLEVIACDPYVDAAFATQHGIQLVSMEDLMRRSDFVTLHTPGTPETNKFINKESIGWMKPTAFLVNTSRGTVVNEPDLAEALQAKRIAGAGLDVFEDEPLSKDHPFLKLDNVLVTAHTAGVDEQSVVDMGHVAAQAIVAIAKGGWPEEWIVNPEVKAKFAL